MRRLSRPGDDHREPLRRGPGGELQRLVGGLVGGENPDLTRDPERLEGLGGFSMTGRSVPDPMTIATL